MQTQSGPRPLLVVISTGSRVYREYLFQALSTQFRVHLFHTAEPSWEKSYLDGWSVVADTFDAADMTRAARDLHARDPIAGLLCWDEGRLLATARVAKALGLPGGEPAVIARVRDKARTRQVLLAAGVAQPDFREAADAEQAVAAADELGYPVVLKPRGMAGSLGVVRADEPDEVRRLFDYTFLANNPDMVVHAGDDTALVEQCVTGEEISVDSVVYHGEVTPLFVARKRTGFPPYFEETGHIVAADDPALADPALLADLRAAHAALGFRDGFTHTEVMLTAAGPRLIEVNGRLGGDLIPYLGALATGVDPALAAARTACGLPPVVAPDRQRVAGIRFLYVAEEDTAVLSIGFDTAALPAGVEQATVMVTPPLVLSPPPAGTVVGRYAFVVAVADTVAGCEAVLDEAQAAVELDAV